MTEAQQWLLFSCTLPHELSAPRVALWRKLKKLGAILLHDALWVLPATPALQEQGLWLATEVAEEHAAVLYDALYSQPSVDA
jgi:hypothetical protein